MPLVVAVALLVAVVMVWKMRERQGGDAAAPVPKATKAAAKSSIGVRLGQEVASFQIKSLIRQIEFADSSATTWLAAVAEEASPPAPAPAPEAGQAPKAGEPAQKPLEEQNAKPAEQSAPPNFAG